VAKDRRKPSKPTPRSDLHPPTAGIAEGKAVHKTDMGILAQHDVHQSGRCLSLSDPRIVETMRRQRMGPGPLRFLPCRIGAACPRRRPTLVENTG